MTREQKANVQTAIAEMADLAEFNNATANDETGVVRAVVAHYGFGFEAWFCVCCELADRAARRKGFKDQCDMAIQSPGFQSALAKSRKVAA